MSSGILPFHSVVHKVLSHSDSSKQDYKIRRLHYTAVDLVVGLLVVATAGVVKDTNGTILVNRSSRIPTRIPTRARTVALGIIRMD
jgi:hypothetical protein